MTFEMGLEESVDEVTKVGKYGMSWVSGSICLENRVHKREPYEIRLRRG